MGYVDNNLLPGERVVYQARLHWIIYAVPTVFIAIALFLFIGAATNHEPGIGAFFGGIFLVGGLFILLGRWIKMVTSEFAVTSKRIIIKVGLIKRTTLELLLGQVEAIRVDQGILGRLLGYGTIIVAGTGGTREPFPSISYPLEFRRQVQIQSQP